MTTKKTNKNKTECKHRTVQQKRIDFCYINLLFQMASRIFNENENDDRKKFIQLPIEKLFYCLSVYNVIPLLDVLRDLTRLYSNEFYIELGTVQGKEKKRPLARIFWDCFGLIAHLNNELLEYLYSNTNDRLYLLFNQSDALFDYKHCKELLETYVIQDAEVRLYEDSFTILIDRLEDKNYLAGFRPDKTKIGKKVGFQIGVDFVDRYLEE